MLTNFTEIKQHLKLQSPKKIAIVCPEEVSVLKAIDRASQEGLAEGILIGDKSKITKLLKQNNITNQKFEIISIDDPEESAFKACELVRTGEANAIMKGLIDTSKFMKAALNKEKGLNSGNIISHVAITEIDTYPKLLLITDAAINIAPTLDEKVQIINNAVSVAHKLNIETPKLACCAAIEKVNASRMPATVEASLLSKMNERGQITGCIVDGPLALDTAISKESSKIKKLKGAVAGNADIITCHDIESANCLYKALMFLGGAIAGGVVVGGTAPIILTSRADSEENKYLSIIVSALIS